MSAILEERQMQEMTLESKVRMACLHTLRTAHDVPRLGWHINLGSQTYSLLTELLASVTGEDLAKLRKEMACPNAEGPCDNEDRHDDDAGEWIHAGDVEDFFAGAPPVDRMEILHRLLSRWCPSCGMPRVGPCGCHAIRRSARPQSSRRNGQ